MDESFLRNFSLSSALQKGQVTVHHVRRFQISLTAFGEMPYFRARSLLSDGSLALVLAVKTAMASSVEILFMLPRL